MVVGILLCSLFVDLIHSWPHLERKRDSQDTIGPTCTAGVHNWHPSNTACPPGAVPKDSEYIPKYAKYFEMEWTMYFVNDSNYSPPYDPYPTRNFTTGRGRTFYDMTFGGGALREVYEEKCIPIFMDGPLSKNNNWKCDFINVANTNTAYFITHDDRPIGAPPCCIIGRPFHPPHPNFAVNMTERTTSIIDGVTVDWSSLSLTDSGLFSFGFVHQENSLSYSIPYAFYFLGAPQISSWVYQSFDHFEVVKPNQHWWNIPDSCINAKECPGW